MHDDLFIKICSDFDVGWSVDDVIKDFVEDKIDPNAEKQNQHTVYSDPSGVPHFQMFPSGAAFARNFYRNFPDQCNNTASRLIKLQEKIRNKNSKDSLTQEFLNCNISGKYVNILKIYPGSNVTPHIDVTRVVSLNIGLKNSNLWKTNIYQSKNLRDFRHHPKFSFTMNNGDAYLLNVQNVHSVESEIYNIDKTRYILTYTIKII